MKELILNKQPLGEFKTHSDITTKHIVNCSKNIYYPFVPFFMKFGTGSIWMKS